jgi:hypothetical protein
VFSSQEGAHPVRAVSPGPGGGDGEQRPWQATLPRLCPAAWRKSSHSTFNGNCIEVAALAGELVGVRDSKDSEGPVLVFGGADWQLFLAGIRSGRVMR